MEIHHGQIVERIIRRNGYSISEVARLTNVNRRSVYNWFSQQQLKPNIIFKIGYVLKYDFSDEFPGMHVQDSDNSFKNIPLLQDAPVKKPAEDLVPSYWKDKYINLLEKYNELLVVCMENRA